MYIRTLLLTALVIVAITATAGGDETLYVRARNAEVKESPRGTSETLTVIPFGEEVTATSQRGRWWNVAYHGVEGWVYAGSLSEDEPDEDPSLEAEDGSRLTSEQVDASSVVRGVGPTAMRYADSNAITPEHRMYLDYQQSFVASDRVITELPPNREQITTDDIEAFMREGHLGPYAQE